MTQKAPGRSERIGITLPELFRMFPDDETAEKWFIKIRWPDGVFCHGCGGFNILMRKNRRPQPFHCRDCRKDFSTKTGTLMQGSNIGFQKWAIALYLFSTNLKGVSSMKLHRDLGITQKSAWHMAHRIRETWQETTFLFPGPVEVDETYVGGKVRNMTAKKRFKWQGTGGTNKAVVVGAKDRATNHVRAKVVPNTGKGSLQGFIHEHVADGAEVYTDDHGAYRKMDGYSHEVVNHTIGEYVRDKIHTNGVESFWSMFKRGYMGTYHKMSFKHLDRYVGEFAGRHNIRPFNTEAQMQMMAASMNGKQLRYRDLTA